MTDAMSQLLAEADDGTTPWAGRLVRIMADVEAFGAELGESAVAQSCETEEIAFAVNEVQMAMLGLAKPVLRIVAEELADG